MVMKSRKQVRMNEVVDEVHRMIILFNAEVRTIKLRIDSLIQREYIKRDPNDRNNLFYLP
jgi:hypothetical protein